MLPQTTYQPLRSVADPGSKKFCVGGDILRYTVFVQVCPVAGIPDHNVGGTLRYLTVWTNHDCAVVGQTAADRTVNANHAIVGQRHIIVDGEGFTRRDFQPLAAGDRLDRFKGGSAINLSIVPLEDYTAPVRFLILAVVTDGGRDNKDIVRLSIDRCTATYV